MCVCVCVCKQRVQFCFLFFHRTPDWISTYTRTRSHTHTHAHVRCTLSYRAVLCRNSWKNRANVGGPDRRKVSVDHTTLPPYTYVSTYKLCYVCMYITVGGQRPAAWWPLPLKERKGETPPRFATIDWRLHHRHPHQKTDWWWSVCACVYVWERQGAYYSCIRCRLKDKLR